MQIIKKYKYPVETHFVVTKDDYILRLHRIPQRNQHPVLIVHGLGDSSGSAVMLGPNISLSYYLYDLGYDVWLANTRGNRYSRNHTKLNPNTDEDYWEFSWHQVGIYDLPATIDYVLQETAKSKLTYIGHSQVYSFYKEN